MPLDTVAVNPGWTWTATIGAVQTVILSGGMAALVWGMFRGIGLLWQRNNESKKQDTDAAALVRKEMMDFNAALQARVSMLEDGGREERKRFDEEIAATRKEHAQEIISIRKGYEEQIRELRDEMNGLRRQMAQWVESSGAAQALGRKAPTASFRKVEESGLGDLLRGAYSITGTGENDKG